MLPLLRIFCGELDGLWTMIWLLLIMCLCVGEREEICWCTWFQFGNMICLWAAGDLSNLWNLTGSGLIPITFRLGMMIFVLLSFDRAGDWSFWAWMLMGVRTGLNTTFPLIPVWKELPSIGWWTLVASVLLTFSKMRIRSFSNWLTGFSCKFRLMGILTAFAFGDR